MQIPSPYWQRGLIRILVGLVAFFPWGPSRTQAAPTKTAPKAMVFSVEFDGTCGPPVLPGRHSTILNSTAPQGMVLVAGGVAPLVSHERVIYSMVGTSGTTSLPAAKIFAEVAGGGELSFKSDKGQNVVLQADMKTVCWDVDQRKVLDLAKSGGADRAIIAILRADDLTAEVNPGGELGQQKSALVSLEVVMLDARNGMVLGAFSDDVRQMDLSMNAAVRKGAKLLLGQAMKSISTRGDQ